ncbi:MAG: hypothetical protein U1E56_09710 [Bauldia sp.]
MRLILVWLAVCIASNTVAAEQVVEIPSRGQSVRALLIPAENPLGSVILLAGGHGNLALQTNGRIGWGQDNHLVRSRAAYAAAGYNTLVPDIAPDLKTPSGGGVDGYRADARNATDIAAAIVFMRTLKPLPVVLIGTSRGTISAANAAARLSGRERPDALVISSGFLGANPRDFTVAKMAGNDPRRLDLPLLVIEHRADTCSPTAPSAVEPFRSWYETGGRRLDILWMEGGDAPRGDPCEARGAHGFPGLDKEVVTATDTWIKRQRFAR